MNPQTRNVVPVLYGMLTLVGFIISATVGVVVCIVGGMLTGFIYAGFPRADPDARERPPRASGPIVR